MSILFYYIIIQIILINCFKRTPGILSCGIGCFSPIATITAAQRDLVYQKMKILGLYLQDRGGDGCGMLINGEVYKGWDDWKGPNATKKDTKAWKNFISDLDNQQNITYEGGIIMIHNRKAAGGGVPGKDTNHPFTIVNEDPKKTIHLVHNGQIRNHQSLTSKNDIPYSSYQVDSEALTMLIDKVGLKVLDEYEGDAALAWNFAGDPNSLYIFHGSYFAHPDETEEKGDIVWEERPMWYMKTTEGMYFASLPEYLRAIASKDDKICVLPYNIVLQVKNGKFTTFKHEVKRLYGPNCKEKAPVTTYQHSNYYNWENDENCCGNWQQRNHHRNNNSTLVTRGQQNQGQGTIPFDIVGVTPVTSKIWNETRPYQSLDGSGRVFFWQGRFRMPNASAALCMGKIFLDKKGVKYDICNMNTTAYYFYRGVMLKGMTAWNNLQDDIKNKKILPDLAEDNFAFQIGKYSMYPVTNVHGEAVRVNNHVRFGFYMDSQRYRSKSFTPLFSSRNYHIGKNGYLDDIKTSDKKHETNMFFSDFSIVKSDSNSVYDKIFATIDEAMKSIKEQQRYALKYFVFDYMTKDPKSTLDPDNEELNLEVSKIIADAVTRQTSIRTEIEDAGNVLERYEEKRHRIADIPGRYWIKKSVKIMLGIDSEDSKETTIEQKLLETEKKPEVEVIVYENTGIVKEPELDEPDHEAIEEAIVRDKIGELIVVLGEVNNSVDELAAMLSSKYAQDVVDTMYKTLDNIKHSIADIAIENDDEEIAGLINRTLNTAVV